MKSSGDKGFPVQDSGTSGLHVCSREVSICCMGESWRFKPPLKISLLRTANEKHSNEFKNPLSPEPFVSHAKGPRLREAKRAMGTRMHVRRTGKMTLLPILCRFVLVHGRSQDLPSFRDLRARADASSGKNDRPRTWLTILKKTAFIPNRFLRPDNAV